MKRADRAVVDMAQEEVVHGAVLVARVLVPGEVEKGILCDLLDLLWTGRGPRIYSYRANTKGPCFQNVKVLLLHSYRHAFTTGDRVLPVAVEAAVREACHFGQDVQDAFPDEVPCEELFDEEGEDEFDWMYGAHHHDSCDCWRPW